ncbi:hypothetical protein LNKW23_05630 [Paralimibaculum aggregatum]|uniref:Alginate export domain-containing protein n=2 Tax=Paralimibaculum aggregatum TaxID=3036245 RepID=A0ABQ6LGK8_9RHOB|nr:hypothetical protein LNKW23_05630 [Limibaculum sp. NKW23]
MVMRHRRPEATRFAAGVFCALAGIAALIALVSPAPAGAEEANRLAFLEPEHAEIYGNVELEGTLFFQPPQFDDQRRDDVSMAIEPTLLLEWNDGDTVFTFTPFTRFDSQDDHRTHFDIRDMKIEQVSGDWAVTFGVDREFWGRTEAVHLVDIVNQTDLVEGIDGEEKLGQPLLKLSRLTGIGEFSAYYFPYFRKRTLPGPEGRLRLPLPYATERAEFETGAEEWTPAFAGRYTGVFGDVDLGLHGYWGLSRDPSFRVSRGRLLPVYSRIAQAGIDAQYTFGATLWKGEAILRQGQRNASFERELYVAATGGLEHTLYQIGGTDADLGLLLEGAYDSRGDEALTAFDNEVVGGLRLTLNDTQDTAVLLTGAVDVTDGSASVRLEAERRLTPHITAAVEAQGFFNTADDFVNRGFADDSFVRLKIKYYF